MSSMGGGRDIDDVLTQLGTGRWNLIIFLLSAFSAMRIPPQVLSGAFVAPAIKYTCVLPSEATSNVSIIIANSSTTTPIDQCHYWDATLSSEQPCTQWLYDTSVFQSTLTSEFNLVCSRSSLRSSYSSLYMFGAMFGSLIVGHLADRKGRKLTLSLSLVSATVFSLLVGWSPSLVLILICRFFLGVTHPILLSSFYTISVEVCEQKHRGTVAIVSALPWALGTIAWGGLAYLVRSWRWLNTVASLPAILFLPCIWIIDESPRWLVVQGHHTEAIKVLRKAARMNKATLPDDRELLTIMEATAETTAKKKAETQPNSNSIKKYVKEIGLLFSTGQMRLRTFTMWLLFFVASMVFYGLSLSAVSLSADPFIYMAVGGLMEVPSYTVTAPIIDKWGRKLPTALAYLLCGVTILALAVTPNDISWLVMTLAMSGKLAISMAYQVIYMYILELLPTEARLQGLGTSMFASRIGSIMSPYITDVAENVPWLPSSIFGASSLVAGVATLLLPETNKKHMAETVHAMSTSSDPAIASNDGIQRLPNTNASYSNDIEAIEESPIVKDDANVSNEFSALPSREENQLSSSIAIDSKDEVV